MTASKHQDFAYTVTWLKSHGIAWATFHGEVTMGNITKSYAAYQQDPNYGPEIDELLDFSDASVATMRAKEFEIIRAFMSSQTDRHNTMSAIVVSSKLEYGLSRMMGGLMSKDAPVDRGVFYTVDEALEWLRPGQADEIRRLRSEQMRLGSAAE